MARGLFIALFVYLLLETSLFSFSSCSSFSSLSRNQHSMNSAFRSRIVRIPLHSVRRTATTYSSYAGKALPTSRVFSTKMHSTTNSRNSSNNASRDVLSAITHRLSPAQRDAVVSPCPGISVCTAGPGSGKTRVLAHRVAYLLQHYNVSSRSVVALTFTNKAGQEMKKRISSLLECSDVPGSITVGTFHSFCSMLLRTYGKNALKELTKSNAITDDFAIFDRRDSLRLVKNLLEGRNMDSLVPKDVLSILSKRKFKEIAGASQQYQKELKPFAGFNATMLFKPEMETLYRDYTDSLRQSNALDFDDLLLFGWRLLRDFPDVRRRVQVRYQHILVDEYQDTNLSQYEIVRLMYCDKYLYQNTSATFNSTAIQTIPTAAGRSLFVVGDANQAIYSWRGALPENIDRIYKDYPSVASAYGLKENYRCSHAIATAANALLDSTVTISAVTEQSLQNDSPVRIIKTKDGTAQAKVIANLLQRPEYVGKSRAVLYRTNAQSRQLETALLDAKVPYEIIGGWKFYERREVALVLGYLKLLANPRDTVAARRIINTPTRGIGPVTQDAFFAWVRQTCREAEERGHIPPTLMDFLYAINMHSDGMESSAFELGDACVFDLELADVELSVSDSDSGSRDSEMSHEVVQTSSDVEADESDFLLRQELASSCPLTKRERNMMNKFAHLMVELDRYSRNHSLTALVVRLLRSSAFEEFVKKISKDESEELDRLENIKEFLKGTTKFASPSHGGDAVADADADADEDLEEIEDWSGRAGLKRFIDHVALFTGEERSSSQGEEQDDDKGAFPGTAVQLMTVHASKGLEFDMVVLSGLEEGVLPLVRKDADHCRAEEERRLMYVGMTRAKSDLVITFREKISQFKGNRVTYRKAEMSRFLNPLISLESGECVFQDDTSKKKRNESSRNVQTAM